MKHSCVPKLQTLRWKKCIGSRSNFDFLPRHPFLFERNWHPKAAVLEESENEILFPDKTWAVSSSSNRCHASLKKPLLLRSFGNLRLFFTIGWVVNSLSQCYVDLMLRSYQMTCQRFLSACLLLWINFSSSHLAICHPLLNHLSLLCFMKMTIKTHK